MSEVSICNRALARIGSDPITSLSGTDTKSGRCNQLYGAARDTLLASHPWNFAMTRASLAALETGPEWGLTYAYELPIDCLRAWRIDGHVNDEWKVEGRTIVTDLTAPLSLLYIAQVADTAKFSAGFTQALVLQLAAELAMPLAQNASMADMMFKAADDAARRARSQDAQEGRPDDVTANVFTEARTAAYPLWWR